MKSLVFEQWQGGHYFNYLEYLVPRLASIGEVVVAITDIAAASPLFARQLGHLRQLKNVRFDTDTTLPRGNGPMAVRFDMVRNLAAAVRRNQPDFVFVPSADEYLLALPLQALLPAAKALRELPIEAVIHYKSYTAVANAREKALSGVQRALLHVGAFSQLNFVNCLQYEAALTQRLPLLAMARAAGDPVPQPPLTDRHQARLNLGLPTDGRLIGMVGGLDDRKAVPATLAAFKAAGLGPSDRLLLAGKMTAEYAQLVERDHADLVQRGTLIVIDRYLGDTELVDCFAALDLHCSVYKDFSGLSSLMLKSVAAGVRVLVNNRPGWTRAMASRFDIGDSVDPDDVEAFARDLRTALEKCGRDIKTEAVARLLKFHSIDNFTLGLTSRFRAVAGHPSLEPAVDWSWVLQALAPERRALV